MCQKQILGHQIFSISPNSELWFDFFDAEQSVWTNSPLVNYLSELFFIEQFVAWFGTFLRLNFVCLTTNQNAVYSFDK